MRFYLTHLFINLQNLNINQDNFQAYKHDDAIRYGGPPGAVTLHKAIHFSVLLLYAMRQQGDSAQGLLFASALTLFLSTHVQLTI